MIIKQSLKVYQEIKPVSDYLMRFMDLENNDV